LFQNFHTFGYFRFSKFLGLFIPQNFVFNFSAILDIPKYGATCGLGIDFLSIYGDGWTFCYCSFSCYLSRNKTNAKYFATIKITLFKQFANNSQVANISRNGGIKRNILIQKSKFKLWSRSRKFGQKSKFWSKIEIMVKNRKFG